jgi:hypothetical protein
MEGIFDKNPNLTHTHLDHNQIFAVGPNVLKPGKNWYLGGNTCVKGNEAKKCVENYIISFYNFLNSTESSDWVDEAITVNNLDVSNGIMSETTENCKSNFLSIILAGLFMISLLLNVIQFVRTKRVTQTTSIQSPANEPVTYYLTMNAETVGARSLNLRPNNDRVEVAACDDGEEHIYDVLKEGNTN